MARVEFEWDPEFDENVYKASNKSGSSLRPLIDTVRNVTDQIYLHAREALAREAGKAEGEVQGAKNRRFSASGKETFAYAKAKAAALRSGRNSVFPTMEYDGKEIYGRVAIYRRSSSALEFGGIDPVGEIGKGTGRYVEHPPYAFLRRAIDKAA
jgi:hypothetical protein